MAQSQLGYTESTDNYIVTEDGETIRGYTRYGAWYGVPYGDWCAMFVSFCLNYADIPEDVMPRESGVQNWIEKLSGQAEGYEDYDLYVDAEAYTPVPGDLVFFDMNKDGTADHVGIVAEYSESSLMSAAGIKTIEGNSGNTVQNVTYRLDDETILGYAVLPANPDLQMIQAYADDGISALALDTTGLNGKTFALVNGKRGMAMLADTSTSNRLDAQAVGANFTENTDGTYTVTSTSTDTDEVETLKEQIMVWTFETANARNGTYYLSTTANGSKQYLVVSGYDLNLTSNQTQATALYVQKGTGSYEGMVRLATAATGGYAPNLYSPYYNNFGGYSDSGENEWFYLVSDIKKSNVVPGVTPNGTVINMFDYWTTTRWPDGGDNAEGNQLESGINKDKTLKFVVDGITGNGDINAYQSAVRKNIVQNKLVDNYPCLNGTTVGTDNVQSLAYLFDPNNTEMEGSGRQTFRNVGGLLQVNAGGYYYYDCTENFAELNEDTGQFVLYDTWGVTPANTETSSNGQFFPFNSFEQSGASNSRGSDINHYFGMTLTSRFVQRYDGHTDASKNTPTLFEFSGDDDVWIFIDGVLVADLGGIRDKTSVDIDFSTGKVTIKTYDGTTLSSNTIRSAFNDADVTPEGEWNGDTFANNTYHTLKFYYLERGGGDSNLSLKYNLTTIPSTEIYKVNQYGDPVPNADFAVYAADNEYNYLSDVGQKIVDLPDEYSYDEDGNILGSGGKILVKALYKGTTNARGEMIFVDDDNMPYSLSELREMFGDYFILKEIGVPDGYRLVSEEIHLRIAGSVLQCSNTYESGAWAAPLIQVSAPNNLTLVKAYNGSNTVGFYNPDESSGDKENGTLFAVVMKYNGNGEAGLETESNWSPVYGSDEAGYTVVKVAEDYDGDYIAAAIGTAQKAAQYGDVEFGLSASGAMQLELTNIPGDITKYYYMLQQNKGDLADTKYTIAYYWTPADSLNIVDENGNMIPNPDVKPENTFRVDSDNAINGFERIFGATIEVPNLVNRLLVQKFDEDGNLVNGAHFAMYEVSEEGDGEIYYVANDGTLICLDKDTDGDNKGDAVLQDGSEGTYEVNENTAEIRVTVGESSYTIKAKPYVNGGYVAITANATRDTGEDGTAYFTNMSPGNYYVREICSPAGYAINSTEVMVQVTDKAVYANAGTADDGVTVARGPGYVVSSLNTSASQGEVDNTLSWIYTMLKVKESSSFPVGDETVSDWLYAASQTSGGAVGNQSEAMRTYLEYMPGADGGNSIFNYQVQENAAVDSDGNTYSPYLNTGTRRLYTDVGWSYLEIFQNFRYGKTAAAERGANYTDLHGEGDENTDISHLFSRSVYVQVTDERSSNLKISKTVTNAPDDNTGDNTDDNTGEAFEFIVDFYTVNLKLTCAENHTHSDACYEKEKVSLTGDYACSVYKAAGEGEEGGDAIVKTETITLANDGSASITLTDGQYAIIGGLPYNAYYTVTETAHSGYSATVVKDAGEEDEESGTNSITGKLDWEIADENGNSTTVLDNTSTVDFTNTYTYLSELTILKVDGANTAKKLPNAEFVFYYTAEGEDNVKTDLYYNPADSTWVVLSEDSAAEDAITLDKVKLTSDPDGEIALNNIPDGDYILKEIKAPDGYNLTNPITVNVRNGKILTASAGSGTNSCQISNDGLILTVYNSAGYELPETGGSGTLRFTIGGLLLTAGSLLYGYRLRRKRERRLRCKASAFDE